MVPVTGDLVGISHECRITGLGKSDPIDMRGFGPRMTDMARRVIDPIPYKAEKSKLCGGD